MLIDILKDLLSRKATRAPARNRAASFPAVSRNPGVRQVLNVGANSKLIPIPEYFDGWKHLTLDIDPRTGADVICDARELAAFPAAVFDAVYCSHNLEHFYRHDAYKVLQGFQHVLKADGFAEIRVPDIDALMRHVLANHMDLEDVLYQSPAGPITVHDVIYGFGEEIERSGQDYFAHKTGFTPKSLPAALEKAGFPVVRLAPQVNLFEVRAFAFKSAITPFQQQILGLDREP